MKARYLVLYRRKLIKLHLKLIKLTKLFDFNPFVYFSIVFRHLFAIAGSAYSKMVKDKEDQVIVIWLVLSIIIKKYQNNQI